MRERLMILGGVLALVMALSAASFTGQESAPRSAEDLAERYKRAHSARDTGAIRRLFYWGSSTEKTRTLVASFIEHDVAHAAKKVTVEPLGPHELMQYTQDGVTYRMTLPPVAKLVIDFLPRTERGGQYKSESTSYFIGARDGSYWLVTAEPMTTPPRSP